ncbi:lamin tail domain-containing protein [Desertivirga arenae]|uniref:lamin tail domain-containing protein n=1 Tax=Desertivirga arenae TaxID=2810309 RepID=UPI001A977581|nr:lamin tail domain-containing protein [Pedobacter sp. SYSU D00823]
MRKCLVFSLIFFAKFALSQVNDNFDDGNFVSNPAWTGSNSSNDFSVINNQLRSNSTAANSSFYLSTVNTLATACTWEFYCNLQFATSGSNYVDIYLISDQRNLLSAAINGYFVRIGNTSDDICLYKRSGASSTITKIIDGIDGSVNSSTNNRIKVKVTRSAAGVFTLERDINNSAGTYITEGSVADINFLTSAFFGFLVQQSTSSFFQKHFFDDVVVRPLITDNTPPDILSAKVLSKQSIEIVFDEEVEDGTAKIPANYFLNNNVGSPASITSGVIPNSYILTFSKDLITANYTLCVSNVADRSGNTIVANTPVNFQFLAPYTAKKGDVLFSEIFADPSPQVELPTVEFVEIRNVSDQTISLQNWKFYDPTAIATLPLIVLEPDDYLIMCAKADTSELKKFGRVLGVSPWPSLNNTGDFIGLKNEKGASIDSVEYRDDWFKDAEKKGGGWTLELIDPKAVCRGTQNWTASTDISGGTPGRKNSVKDLDTAPIALKGATVLDSVTIRLSFNRPVDSLSASVFRNYVLNKSLGTLIRVRPVSPGFVDVDLIYDQEIPYGSKYEIVAKNITDCAGTIIQSTSNTAVFDYAAPYVAAKRDVVINEIFADPSPQLGLPPMEFLELFNTTTTPISLHNWKVADHASSGTLPLLSIQPGEYLILCAKADTAEFKQYGRVIGISPWPSLNNSGDLLKLISNKGIVIDSVDYKDSWYKDSEKKSGGWTLEQMYLNASCKGIQNWAASIDVSGGTPGKLNSVSMLPLPQEVLSVKEAVLIDSITLRIGFNRSVDSLFASFPENFAINNGMGKPISARAMAPGFMDVELQFDKNIGRGKVYTVTVSHVTDCSGTLIKDGNNSMSFTCPDRSGKEEILISEILFNPRREGVDFVEIYNNSEKEFDLKDLAIATVKGGADSLVSIKRLSTTQVLFKPHSYLALTIDPENIKKEYASANSEALYKMSSMPAFNDDAGTVVIVSNGVRADQFSYSEKMHFPLIKDAEGVSLERVSFSRASTEPGNFRSAASSAGFATPGYKNSQAFEAFSGDEEVSLVSKTFSPDNDGFEDALTLLYHFGQNGLVANASVYNDKGVLIRKLYRNVTLSTEGALVWDGMDDHAARASVGIYVLYLEVFDLNGKVKKYRNSCVLAARL